MTDSALLLLQAAADSTRAYGEFPVIGARGYVWITAEVHLMFAAFVLGVPMFAVVTEAIGIFGGDERYDRLSKEFTRLLLVAYSATAIWGAMLVFGLSTLYPSFWAYLTTIFAPSMWLYAGLFFIESFTLYLYYYGWDRWKKGRAKFGHWTLGILLNVWGTIVMFIANSWLTYMMSPPRDITPTTDPTTIKLWHAIANATWMPINVHRVIANVVFGGAIVGAYASYRFLAARTDEERAHYDWMGYVGAHRTAVRGLLAGARDLSVRSVDGDHHDGRLHELVVGNPGVPHRGAVPDGELLSVDRHGPNSRRGAVPALHQVPVDRVGARRHRVGHAPHHDRGLEGARGHGRLAPPVPGRPGRDERQEHRGQPDDPHHVSVVPPVPPRQHATGRAVGAHGDHHPGSDVRGRSGGRAVLRHPRLLRRSDRAHRVQRLPGAGGALVHRVRHGDRHPHGARRPIARRDPVGENAAPVAVRVVHPGRHVHLADGPDGARALRDPSVLARVAGHAGHEQVRRHPGAGLRLENDQPVRADLPFAGSVRILARRARREVHLRRDGRRR